MDAYEYHPIEPKDALPQRGCSGLAYKIFARSFWLYNSFVIRKSSIHENVICKILFAKLNRLVYMRVYVPDMIVLVLLAYKYS